MRARERTELVFKAEEAQRRYERIEELKSHYRTIILIKTAKAVEIKEWFLKADKNRFDGTIVIDGDEWERLRRLVRPMLDHGERDG